MLFSFISTFLLDLCKKWIMSWSENLFNLVGIRELSYPEALA